MICHSIYYVCNPFIEKFVFIPPHSFFVAFSYLLLFANFKASFPKNSF